MITTWDRHVTGIFLADRSPVNNPPLLIGIRACLRDDYESENLLLPGIDFDIDRLYLSRGIRTNRYGDR